MAQRWTLAGRVILVLVLVLTSLPLGACARGQPAGQTTSQPTTAAQAATDTPGPPTTTPTLQPTLPPPTAEPPIETATAAAPTAPPPTTPPQPTATATATAQVAASYSPAVSNMVAGLEGLPIEEFLDESYEQWLLRNPEYLTALGLSDAFGLRNDRLNDLSDGYLRETQELEAAILELLRAYDRNALTPEQQVSYDVYEWWLADRVRGHPFAYHNYPVHHFLNSYHDELVRLFTELHPLSSREDAEDYVARLSQVDIQVEQVLAGLELRKELGVIPPRFILEWTLGGLQDLAHSSARATPYYTTFRDKVNALEGLDDADKQALLQAAETEIGSSVLPAFGALLNATRELMAVATNDAGVWKLPDGDDYYAYILRHESSSDLTADEIHELGLAEVTRIQAEMRVVFEELGYPQDASLSELMGRAIDDGGFYDIRTQEGKDRYLEAYEARLDEVEGRLDQAFDISPEAEVIVVGDQGFTGGGYYVSASLDGSRPGAFHTGIGGSWAPKFNMPTVAYHEAIPGHHFQIAIAQEADLPFFRTDLFFNGYAEGWALYAERLGHELGLYEGDPYGDLGRLQLELLRAVRLVTDTGIHAQRWTREEAKAYMNEALGDPSGRWSHEVERYIVLPGQATGYKVGMLKILELRQRAMDALGDQFDIKEFHRVVLGNGSMPLEILERVVQDYIDEHLAAAEPDLLVEGMSDAELEITYVQNAGFLIESGDTKIVIDSLYKGLGGRMVPRERRELMERALPPFDYIDLVLATHIHGDHFDPYLVGAHLENNPTAAFASTDRGAKMIRELFPDLEGLDERVTGLGLKSGEREQLSLHGIDLEAVYLSHGAGTDADNHGYILSIGGYKLLHTGDIGGAAFLQDYEFLDEEIDFALVPWFYLTEPDAEGILGNIGADYYIPMHFYHTGSSLSTIHERVETDYPDAILFRKEMERLLVEPASG